MNGASSEHLMPSHPTAAEWDRRKQHLPDAAAAQIAAFREERARQDRAAADAEMARLMRVKRLRDAFEAAVASLLVEAGASWLAAYRVADHDMPPVGAFDLHREGYYALFDPTPAGLWPIRVYLFLTAGDKWLPYAAPYLVSRPRGGQVVASFAVALRLAAEHSSTPF